MKKKTQKKNIYIEREREKEREVAPRMEMLYSIHFGTVVSSLCFASHALQSKHSFRKQVF